MYNVHYIYFIFAIMLLGACFLKNIKLKAVLITLLFVLFFVCAEIGADYGGYKWIYDNSTTQDVHGEFLYVFINQVLFKLGVSYNLFRFLFLTFFIILFAYSIFKLSPNFALSFLLSFLIYIVYLVSAYRQLATMAIFLFSIYLFFYKEKRISAIILNFIAIFFHKLAILQFLILIIVFFFQVVKPKSKWTIKTLSLKKHLFILALCLVIRCGMVIILKVPFVQSAFAGLGFNYTSNVEFLPPGLITRVGMFIILLFLNEKSNYDNKREPLTFIYYLGMLLYFMIPLELIMGRLINNIKILEVVLIPMLFYNQNNNTKYFMGYKKSFDQSNIFLIFAIVLAFAVFIVQMLNQYGYYPYINYFLGEV